MQRITAQRKFIVYIVAALVGILSLTAVVLAQQSANFDLSTHVVDGGGGQRQSANFVIQDSMGQTAPGIVTSANARIVGGYLQDQVAAGGDAFEVDNSCGNATVIDTVGSKQQHTFHAMNDQDWLRFTAQAGKTYIIEVNNVGDAADAIILLQDACDQPTAGQGTNSFGSTVRLEWDSVKNGDYFVKLQQFDPAFFGDNANYEVSVRVDNVPPSAPQNPRCLAINATTLGLQWKKSPERDVKGYRIAFTGSVSGNEDVDGATTTFYELGGLTPNQPYKLRVRSLDFSGNESQPSGEVECVAQDPVDSTQPVLALANPAGSAVYSTTANLLTFSGNATDAGNNLSRVRLRNTTTDVEKWDYSLTGSNDEFRVADVSLSVGDNNVQLTVIDAAGNSSQTQVTVRRLGQVSGAVLIVAGHNETFGLQTNIYNAANRAYRIFRSAGFTDEDIFYIAPTAQDVDGSGGNQVDAASSPAAVEDAIKNWAKQNGRVGPDKPFFVYMVDHGFAEKFCASGCGASGSFSPAQMDEWIRELEDATGVEQVSIVYEACQSGSFIDRFNGDVANSLSKAGRVIITSTGRENNAYASAEGAYFSDAFFSCVADSNNLKVCFDEGVQAVQGTGVDQTPWMDDNGDGISNASDGTVAQQRVVTRFFSSVRPQIGIVNVNREGANGTFTAKVEDGAEEVALVWAAVFPPDFVEPDGVTLNLSVPTVRLEQDPNDEDSYSFTYANGFPQEGDYRIIFYAQDRLGIHAKPKQEGELTPYFLPSLYR